MNWIRLKCRARVFASVLTVSVFARPGTPSTSRVALRKDRDQHAFEEVVLTDDDALDFVEHALHQVARSHGP